MRTTRAMGGGSRFSNLNKFARELLCEVPIVPSLKRPAVYMQVDTTKEGLRILIETADPQQASELLLTEQGRDIAESSGEYVKARFESCGIEVLDSRVKLAAPAPAPKAKVEVPVAVAA